MSSLMQLPFWYGLPRDIFQGLASCFRDSLGAGVTTLSIAAYLAGMGKANHKFKIEDLIRETPFALKSVGDKFVAIYL